MTPHRITSRAEMHMILAKVKSGDITPEDAFASIDLTLRFSYADVADWLDKKAAELREATKP